MMPSKILIHSLRIGEKRERKRERGGGGGGGGVGKGLLHSNSNTLESVVHLYLIGQTHTTHTHSPECGIIM